MREIPCKNGFQIVLELIDVKFLTSSVDSFHKHVKKHSFDIDIPTSASKIIVLDFQVVK